MFSLMIVRPGVSRFWRKDSMHAIKPKLTRHRRTARYAPIKLATLAQQSRREKVRPPLSRQLRIRRSADLSRFGIVYLFYRTGVCSPHLSMERWLSSAPGSTRSCSNVTLIRGLLGYLWRHCTVSLKVTFLGNSHFGCDCGAIDVTERGRAPLPVVGRVEKRVSSAESDSVDLLNLRESASLTGT